MKQVFDIPAIHCSSCVMLLEELEEVDGIQQVNVDLRHKTAEIDYDESQINLEEIIAEIQKISGYQAVVHV